MSLIQKQFNKRGNILDIPLIGIFIFVFLVVIILSFMILSTINDSLHEQDDFSNASLDIIQHQVDIFPGIWDKGLLFVVVGLGIFTWISAFFVRSHPVFFIFGVFLIVIYIFVFGLLSNTYQDLADNAEIKPYADAFPLSNFLMTKFPIFMALISFITAIVTYSKGSPQF